MLKLSLPFKADTTFSGPAVTSKKFRMEANAKNIETVSFNEKNKVITLTVNAKSQTYSINFGDGKWIEGTTTMLGPSLVEGAKNHFAGLPPSQIAGSYSWKDPKTLEMKLRYIDSPHSLQMTITFDNNSISVDMLDSFKASDKKITLKGESAN
jgi:hypothetical protein